MPLPVMIPLSIESGRDHVKQHLILPVFAFLLAIIADSAHAQQPPDVVQSDTLGNTAMGFNALISNAGTQNVNGDFNTAAGYDAMSKNTTGSENVAFGYGALNQNVTGGRNAALGDDALRFNLTGNSNAAVGPASLYSNTTGGGNVAVGDSALYNNTTGDANTAIGAVALNFNTGGIQNSAVGFEALFSNLTGNNNLAFGYQALYSSQTGDYNTAIGTYALTSANGATANNAQGYGALFNATTGGANTAQGYNALYNTTTGSHNIGIGQQSGYNQTNGSYNIYLGNLGVAAENGVIRIGDPNAQTAAYMAGVSQVNVTGGTNVVVNSSGQLGVVSSSRRYKEDIQPMGDASERLLKLRPVAFRYKKPNEAGEKPIQYGLIAEEVAEVFPELVVFNNDRQPETVAYQVLASLLLNEFQKEHALNEANTRQLAAQASQLDELKQQFAQLQELNRAMHVDLVELKTKESRVAMR
jgi:trimeric autotransporter adhesin